MAAKPGQPKTLSAGSNPALSANKTKIMITQARKVDHEKKILIVETIFTQKNKTLRLHEIFSLKSENDSFTITTYDTPISHTIGSCDVLRGKEADYYIKRLVNIISKFYENTN